MIHTQLFCELGGGGGGGGGINIRLWGVHVIHEATHSQSAICFSSSSEEIQAHSLFHSAKASISFPWFLAPTIKEWGGGCAASSTGGSSRGGEEEGGRARQTAERKNR